VFSDIFRSSLSTAERDVLTRLDQSLGLSSLVAAALFSAEIAAALVPDAVASVAAGEDLQRPTVTARAQGMRLLVYMPSLPWHRSKLVKRGQLTCCGWTYKTCVRMRETSATKKATTSCHLYLRYTQRVRRCSRSNRNMIARKEPLV